MSGATVSPHGFVGVRGRGYRPWQVDAYATELSRDRDAAWERAARLTVLAREMEEDAERLREAVAQLVPQTYDTLGGRARRLLALAVEEAEEVRRAAEADAQAAVDEAEGAARAVRDAARALADEARGAAQEEARRRLLAARDTADEARAAAEREIAEREAAAAERVDGLLGAAQARLAEAERALAAEAETARHGQEDAEAHAAELIARAVAVEERIGRETEKVLREHREEGDAVRAHMDHVRGSLAALTGRATAE